MYIFKKIGFQPIIGSSALKKFSFMKFNSSMGFVAAGCDSIGTLILCRDCMINSFVGLSQIRFAVGGNSYKQLTSFSSDFIQPLKKNFKKI